MYTHPPHAHTCAHTYAHKHTHKASLLVSNCSFRTGSWQEGSPGRWCSACGSGRQLTLMWLPQNHCARQGLPQPVPHRPLLLLGRVSRSLLLSPKPGLAEGLLPCTDICPPAGTPAIPSLLCFSLPPPFLPSQVPALLRHFFLHNKTQEPSHLWGPANR